MAKKANIQRFDMSYFKANRNEIISFIKSIVKDEELVTVMNEMVSRVNEGTAVGKNIYSFISNVIDDIEYYDEKEIKDSRKIQHLGEDLREAGNRQQRIAL